MNIQELITSGKLELYVAGTLTEREMGDVAAYALAYPEVAGEIEKIERAMLDFLSPVEFFTGEAEKERHIDIIFGRIHNQEQHQTPGRIVSVQRVNRLAFAAITIGLVVMTGVCIWLSLQSTTLKAEMAAIRDNQEKLQNENEAFQDHYAHMQEQLTVMRNILTRRIELKNVAGSKITNPEIGRAHV